MTLGNIKPRLLGHWGTTPGLNLLYAHLNRIINRRDLNTIFIAAPGHGGHAVVASTYLESTYSEIYPGTATTPFDMYVLNKIDRFHLVVDVVDRVANFGSGGAYLREHMAKELVRHSNYIRAVGEDLAEIRGWECEG